MPNSTVPILGVITLTLILAGNQAKSAKIAVGISRDKLHERVKNMLLLELISCEMVIFLGFDKERARARCCSECSDIHKDGVE